jgi:hypothetical protein
MAQPAGAAQPLEHLAALAPESLPLAAPARLRSWFLWAALVLAKPWSWQEPVAC